MGEIASLRDAACEYALRGWHIFPINPQEKTPHSQLVPQGHKEASSYAPDALYWWSRCPSANVGLACRKSGLVVLDIDPRHGGDESLWELERELGELPPTLISMTPTGGRHIIFQDPGGEFKKELAPGVDLKANGYIVLPPSVRWMGKYEWAV